MSCRLKFLVEDQAADCISFVRLFTARSISAGVLSFTLRRICWSTRLWNLNLSVYELNNLGYSCLVSGEALTVNITEEWSELGSRRFSVLQYRLFGILATKMSKISGFLWMEVGQYVGSRTRWSKNFEIFGWYKILKN